MENYRPWRNEFVPTRLCFDDLKVGDNWCSQRRTITEADIVNFACLTWDHDPLHVDALQAEQSPFKKIVAHGLLGLAYLAGLGIHAPAVRTTALVAIRDWEFTNPIYVGDTIQAIAAITALEAKGKRRGLVTWQRRLVNQRGETVQSGTIVTLVERASERRT